MADEKATIETVVETPQTVTTQTSNEPETIELTGKDIYSVAFVEADIPYKKGKRNENGKTFTRYTRNNIAFSVPTENPFNKDFLSGNVKSIILTPGVATLERIDDDGNITTVTQKTLQFSSYISKVQWQTLRDEELDDAKSEFLVSRFKKLKGETVSADFLSTLIQASGPSATIEA